MSLFENLPYKYSKKAIQRIIELIEQRRAKDKKSQQKALRDMSKELSTKITDEGKRLERKIEGDEPRIPVKIPAPQNLVVWELFGFFVLISVNPFSFWKYLGTIKGYEFFGSLNDGFDPKLDDYSQTGIHRGLVPDDPWLYTYSSDDDDNFKLDSRVVKLLESQRLLIQNITKGTEGTIRSLGTFYPNNIYKLNAKDSDNNNITWNPGDGWRIKNYPSNKLWSIGSLAFAIKPFFPTYYAIARTVGRGHSYSQFTSQVPSREPSELVVLPTPTIRLPKHVKCGAGVDDADLECELDHKGDWLGKYYDWDGKPWCPTHGPLNWEDANKRATTYDGSMQIAHYDKFGVEWCDIEIWWDYEDKENIFFDVAIGTAKETDPGD